MGCLEKKCPFSFVVCTPVLSFLLCAAGDQALKIWVQRLWAEGALPITITPFLNIVYTRNYGISWGLFQGHTNTHMMVLAGITLIALILLFLWYRRTSVVGLRWGLLLVMAGAVGNFIDRLGWGYVIDFVDAHWGKWHFPAFNLADALITIGFLLMIMYSRRGS